MAVKRSIEVLSVILLLIFLAVVGLACDDEDSAEEDGLIGVVVTLLPQAEFVQKVGADRVKITVMVPPGEDPHIYEPRPSQMTALSKADIYAKVGSGVEFEYRWMEKLVGQNSDMLVVDCSTGIQLIGMGPSHNHETEGEGHEEGMDPHIWLSPKNAMRMVENICAGLIEIDPAHSAFYESNRDSYLGDLSLLDQKLREGLSDVTSRMFMVYHPSFGYFAHAYDLTMLPVEAEGKKPTASALADIIDQAEENNIKVIFASPQSNPKSAEVIADQIGGEVILIDPLARDYIANMQDLTEKLTEAMQ